MSRQLAGHASPKAPPRSSAPTLAHSSNRKEQPKDCSQRVQSRVANALTRRLGAHPNETDLRRAVFRHNSRFRRGEIVLVPRSRGGFSYAQVLKHKLVKSCYINPTITDVRYYAWRVQYCNKQGDNLYKQLPSVFLGKIMNFDMPSRRRRPETAAPASPGATPADLSDSASDSALACGSGTSHYAAVDDLEASDEDEGDDLDGETILFAGFGSSPLFSNARHPSSHVDGWDSPLRERGDGFNAVEREPIEEVPQSSPITAVKPSITAPTGSEPLPTSASSGFTVALVAPSASAANLVRPRSMHHRRALPESPASSRAGPRDTGTCNGESRLPDVGSQASLKDLFHVFLSPGNTFSAGEIVLVPRSGGGMTYGRIEDSARCSCPLGRHNHLGWRVLLCLPSKTPKGGADTEKARLVKELFSCNIGKLHVGQLLYDAATARACVSKAVASSKQVAPQTAAVPGHPRGRRKPGTRGLHRDNRSDDGRSPNSSEYSRDMPFALPSPEEDAARLLLVPGTAAYEFKDFAEGDPSLPSAPSFKPTAAAHTGVPNPSAAKRDSRKVNSATRGGGSMPLFNAMAPLRAPSNSSRLVGAAASALHPAPTTTAPLGRGDRDFEFVHGYDDEGSTQLPPPIFDSETAGLSTTQEDGEASFFVDDITADLQEDSHPALTPTSTLVPPPASPTNSLIDRNRAIVARMKDLLGEDRFNAFKQLSLQLREGMVTPAHYYEQLCLEFGAETGLVFEEVVDLLPDPALQAQLRAAREAAQLFVELKSSMASPLPDLRRVVREPSGESEATIVTRKKKKKKKSKRKLQSEPCRDPERAYASSMPTAPQPGILPLPRAMDRATSFSSPALPASSHTSCLPTTEAASSPAATKPLIVLDAPNVARRHGGQIISARGIQLAVEYYQSRGHKAIGFMPEHYFRRKPTSSSSAAVLVKNKSALSRQSQYSMADDPELVQTMLDDGVLVLTPPQDYDDSYCIEFARLHAGFIVTNDRYWDHIEKLSGKVRQRTLKWIRSHCISFMFVKDEFLPNPDFKFPSKKRVG